MSIILIRRKYDDFSVLSAATTEGDYANLQWDIRSKGDASSGGLGFIRGLRYEHRVLDQDLGINFIYYKPLDPQHK